MRARDREWLPLFFGGFVITTSSAGGIWQGGDRRATGMLATGGTTANSIGANWLSASDLGEDRPKLIRIRGWMIPKSTLGQQWHYGLLKVLNLAAPAVANNVPLYNSVPVLRTPIPLGSLVINQLTKLPTAVAPFPADGHYYVGHMHEVADVASNMSGQAYVDWAYA